MSTRTERMSNLLRAELAGLVRELKDPRVAAATLITITAVHVSDDLSVARVTVSILADKSADLPAGPLDVLRAIGRARPYLQGRIGRVLHAKKVPELRFYLDGTEDRASRIDEILAEVHAQPPVGASSDPGRPGPAPSPGDDDAEPAG